MQKFENFIISHWDADGLICVSLLYKKLNQQNFYTLFTSPFLFKNALIRLISKNENLKELFIFDIAGNKVTLALAACFEKCLWIDHHVWNEKSFPKNVKVINRSAKSCANVVSKYFKINSDLVKIAEQIDTNNVKDAKAEFLRNYIAAIKWKYGKSPLLINTQFRRLANFLAAEKFEELQNSPEAQNLLDEFFEIVVPGEREAIKNAEIIKIKAKKVCFCEVKSFVPAFRIFNSLKAHKEWPFDIISIIYRKNDKTKIEFRTATNTDVYKIAKFFGGGGHKKASGATVNKKIEIEEIVNAIEQLY